jgi:hypothetical protein
VPGYCACVGSESHCLCRLDWCDGNAVRGHLTMVRPFMTVSPGDAGTTGWGAGGFLIRQRATSGNAQFGRD